MRLSLFIVFVTLMQVSAATLAQKVNIDRNNVPLSEVLNDIHLQTGYSFFYDTEVMNKARNVTVHIKDVTINEALRQCFAGQPFTYTINKTTILITTPGQSASAQKNIKITGIVTDEAKQPVPGVTVKLKGTQIVTVTNSTGRYVITATGPADVLAFSSIGFITQEIAIGNSTEINVTLVESQSKLSEVVVVGYGTVKRGDLTGSVSSLKGVDIVKSVDLSVNSAIQGRLSGVQVISTDGAPGADVSLSVRGGSSISASNEPLYVIDGFPQFGGSNLNLNTADIASIEVLKDASATAIYGSRGANGVVIITTKSGETGKFTVNYDSYISQQQIIKKLPVINAVEYAQTQHFILSSPQGSGSEQLYANWPTYADSASINWQDQVYRKAMLQNQNLSFSGGSKDVKVAGSLSYTNQDGIAIGTNFNRYTGRINAITNISKSIINGTTIYLSNSVNNGPSLNGPLGISYDILQARPLIPNGNLDNLLDQTLIGDQGANSVNNPVKELTLPQLAYKDFNANFNTYFQFAILKGLSFKVSFGAKYEQNSNNRFYPTGTAAGTTLNGVANISSNNITNWLSENTVTYNKTFSPNHVLAVLAGFTAQNNVTNSLTEGASNFTIQNLGYNNLALGSGYIAPTSNYINQGLASFLGRVNYTYKEKYLFTASIRSDGSSKFQENKWSTFPSGAFAWKVSNERFMKKIDAISSLKVRTSWGMTGNQSIAPYSTATKFQAYNPILNEALTVGVAPSQLGNSSLKWETTVQTDAGIDIGLLKDRILLTVDGYFKKSRDLLLNSPISLYSGYTTVYRNVGNVQVKGLEFNLSTVNLTGPLHWSSNFNISFNRSKVLSLNDNQTFFATGIVPSSHITLGQYLVKVGDPLGEMYGYKYIGLFKTQEDLINGAQISGSSVLGTKRYADVSGPNGKPDGIIDQNDLTEIGNGNPLFFGGFSNDLHFKGFDLSCLLTFSYGNDIINTLKGQLARPQSYRGGLELMMDSWTPQNVNATQPKWGTSETEYTINSSYLVEDGSYLRLKTLIVGYTLPKSFIKKLSIRKLRLYASGTNLWTLTKYTGYDPEVSYFNSIVTPGSDNGGYPRAKVFTLGINLTL